MELFTVFFSILGVFIAVKCTEAACPTIVSRSQWNAAAPTRTAPLPKYPAPFVIIHHTEGQTCSTQARCSTLVKNIQHHHMSSRKWEDIGYTFLVSEEGKVYEGRGWNKKGTHAPNYNSRSVGIAFIGNYESGKPNSLALQATKDLISCGVDAGHIKSDYKLIGHRQAKNTECPGTSLYNEIKSWNGYDSSVKP